MQQLYNLICDTFAFVSKGDMNGSASEDDQCAQIICSQKVKSVY